MFPELHSIYSIYSQSKKSSCEANTELEHAVCKATLYNFKRVVKFLKAACNYHNWDYLIIINQI